MSAPDDEPEYIICKCQNCSGRIKFNAAELRPGETRHIECPHCHLETLIFNNASTTSGASSSQASAIKKGAKSSKVEFFLFELTRFPVVIGALIILLAIVVTVILAVQTRIPERLVKPDFISYDMVAPTQVPAAADASVFIPQGAKMASKHSFPQPVTDFLLKHQRFSLKEWLDQLTLGERKEFLDNLASVLVTANTKNLTDEGLEQVVNAFSELWISRLKDVKAAREKNALEKSAQFTQLITVAFGLFISLMVLCLILVVLAIERNTRLVDTDKTTKA